MLLNYQYSGDDLVLIINGLIDDEYLSGITKFNKFVSQEQFYAEELSFIKIDEEYCYQSTKIYVQNYNLILSSANSFLTPTACIEEDTPYFKPYFDNRYKSFIYNQDDVITLTVSTIVDEEYNLNLIFWKHDSSHIILSGQDQFTALIVDEDYYIVGIQLIPWNNSVFIYDEVFVATTVPEIVDDEYNTIRVQTIFWNNFVFVDDEYSAQLKNFFLEFETDYNKQVQTIPWNNFVFVEDIISNFTPPSINVDDEYNTIQVQTISWNNKYFVDDEYSAQLKNFYLLDEHHDIYTTKTVWTPFAYTDDVILVNGTIVNVIISEGGKSGDILSTILNGIGIITDTGKAGDTQRGTFTTNLLITDGGISGDTNTLTIIINSIISEGIKSGDTLSTIAFLIASILEGVKSSDTWTNNIISTCHLIDGAVIKYILTPDGGIQLNLDIDTNVFIDSEYDTKLYVNSEYETRINL